MFCFNRGRRQRGLLLHIDSGRVHLIGILLQVTGLYHVRRRCRGCPAGGLLLRQLYGQRHAQLLQLHILLVVTVLGYAQNGQLLDILRILDRLADHGLQLGHALLDLLLDIRHQGHRRRGDGLGRHLRLLGLVGWWNESSCCWLVFEAISMGVYTYYTMFFG